NADDVLVCEYEQRPRGAPSFIDLQHAIRDVGRDDNALRVVFDPQQRGSVEQLAAAEQLCCPTMRFELSPPPEAILSIHGRPGQLATLQQMLAMDLGEG
ncbi:MAG: hypothetical protein DCC57_16985, partial [Chloroflexi bacterium]